VRPEGVGVVATILQHGRPGRAQLSSRFARSRT
jgi:hypothetical protein